MSVLLELRDVTVDFRLDGGHLGTMVGRRPRLLRAVDSVSLSLEAETTLALVGESGSGKSTLARTVVGLVEATSGQVLIDGAPVGADRERALQRRAQIVFQDPTGSLNPALTVERALAEPIRAHGLAEGADLRRRCRELVEMVELPGSVLGDRPRQLSGGQRQRVAIARALALDPDLLIADEPVSALDVSVQAAIIKLLRRLQRELGLAMLFISHDLAVVRQVCDRVAVMYLGTIVEEGTVDVLLGQPRHPYTQALLAAAPRLGRPERKQRLPEVSGEPPSPFAIPSGCRFHPRCPLADPALCAQVAPELRTRDDHSAACHFAWDHEDSSREGGGEAMNQAPSD